MNPARTRHVACGPLSPTRITADGTRDIFIITPEGSAPHVMVPGTEQWAPRVFDLQNVQTHTHDWLDDDGLGDDGPPVDIRPADYIDTILIRGVAEGMVAVDHAPHAEDSPRLLIWTEHDHDDASPTTVPL